jgi:biotin operon repressor
MKLHLHEIEALKAIGKIDPVFSSFAKLEKETGRARNEIKEIIEGLAKIGYLKATPKNEVYLLKDGREYLGLSPASTGLPNATLVKRNIVESVPVAMSKDTNPIVREVPTFTKNQPATATRKSISRTVLFDEIKTVSECVNYDPVFIDNKELKTDVLIELAKTLPVNVSSLLIDIAKDLRKVSGKKDTPNEAA